MFYLSAPLHRAVLGVALFTGSLPGGSVTVEEVCFALQEFWECAVEETEARTFLDRLAELGLIEVLESGKRYRVPASGIGSILLDAIDDVERYAHRALEEMGRG